MSFSIIQPEPELKAFVSHFWVGDWTDTANLASTYYLTAGTLTELAFTYRPSASHPELLFASVQGQTSRSGQFPAGHISTMIGVALYSHALPCLFGIAAHELNNRFTTPVELLGTPGKALVESLASAVTTEVQVRLLSAYFRKLLRKTVVKDPFILKAIDTIRGCRGAVRVEQLAKDSHLSQKQFERRFKEYGGFAPKLYARIVRFETALNSLHSFSSLTAAAYACGYYDQAHFIHDFSAFSGYSPNRFLALTGY